VVLGDVAVPTFAHRVARGVDQHRAHRDFVVLALGTVGKRQCVVHPSFIIRCGGGRVAMGACARSTHAADYRLSWQPPACNPQTVATAAPGCRRRAYDSGRVRNTTIRSVPDSGAHTSPSRPSICRTVAFLRPLGKLSKRRVSGSKRSTALAPKSVTQTLSSSST